MLGSAVQPFQKPTLGIFENPNPDTGTGTAPAGTCGVPPNHALPLIDETTEESYLIYYPATTDATATTTTTTTTTTTLDNTAPELPAKTTTEMIDLTANDDLPALQEVTELAEEQNGHLSDVATSPQIRDLSSPSPVCCSWTVTELQLTLCATTTPSKRSTPNPY
ncbi:hypothetical protein BCR35DRAFT_333463 [Leucosporidium creatinivorum]|uniref:Uncharacterized protein n=1 Tax=Leucosporidium creatinivorum TaxID=106004 RepID=A0A1Y2ERW1_9BASI|nr:hypothetical protein BCR35DRAFT_333463 [Leucosporidium creatinivorum]